MYKAALVLLLLLAGLNSPESRAGGCSFSDPHFSGLGSFEAGSIHGCFSAVRVAFDVHADEINYAGRDKWCAHSCGGGDGSTYCHFKAVQNCEVGRNPDNIGALNFNPNWEPPPSQCPGGYDYDPMGSGCVQACTEGGECVEVCPESACTCSDGFGPYQDPFDPGSAVNWNYCDRLDPTCPDFLEEIEADSFGLARCSREHLPDLDGDGLDDFEDNCPEVANVDQADLDGDGIGTACDTLEGDSDLDGTDDRFDTCPFDVDLGTDFDGDGIDDACDGDDTDYDGVEDYEDADPDNSQIQDDTDGDGIRDQLDDDIDGDGVANGTDYDPYDPTVTSPDDAGNSGNSVSNLSGASGGTGCVTQPSCTGDAIQCEILYQSWLGRCSSESFNSGDFESTTGAGAKAQNDLNTIWKDERDMSLLTGDFLSVTGQPGSCPAPIVLDLSSGAVNFDWGNICMFAEKARPLIIAMFSFTCLLLFFSILRSN